MTKLPTPAELGLSAKFDKWRAGQEEAVNLILHNPKRTTALCQPTGFGKSLVHVAAAILSKKPTCIVTKTRGLQSQYMADFEEIGMVDLRGRRNYHCDMRPDDPDYTCEEGYAARCSYRGTPACECSAAENRAATSSLVVTNYAKWTKSKLFGQGMSHFQQVIFDEGHNTFDALSDAMQVTLGAYEINDQLKMDFPGSPECESVDIWRGWAQFAKGEAEREMLAAQARIAGLADPKPSWVKHFTHMRNLVRKLSVLATARSSDWIVEQNRDGYQFDPIRPGKYAESSLLFRLPRIIVSSATLRPKSMYMIGIGKDHFTFKEWDSSFDPNRCPIYYVPTMRVDAKSMGNLPYLWAMFDRIMGRRGDRKGIIQTTSYEYQKSVKQCSAYAGRMILNDRGEAPTEKIEEYMAAGPGAVLVSPSIGEGYDFKDDLCRYNIALKIPFEPPSKILQAREQEDREYRSYRAFNKLVQQFGRDMRSDKDWSERFIGDQHMEWFRSRYAYLAPSSFHAVWKEVITLPAPPELGRM